VLILFDIDETLVDHDAAFRVATEALHARGGFGIPFEEFVAKWSAAHRRSFDRYLRGELSFEEQRRARVRETVGTSLDDAAVDRLFDIYLSVYESSWRLFDDVLPCLDALAGYRLGVISNGQSRQQRAKLASLGIADRFDHVLISTECAWAKPDPRIFQHARAVAGEPRTPALHVGDSYELDATAARSAGLIGVWLDRQRTRTPEHAAPVVGTLIELPQLVAETIGRGL
jgi:putative hydrolase of the HAD superfamily